MELLSLVALDVTVTSLATVDIEDPVSFLQQCQLQRRVGTDAIIHVDSKRNAEDTEMKWRPSAFNDVTKKHK